MKKAKQMKGEILKLYVIVDGCTGEYLAEWDDLKTARASLRYEYDKRNGDHIRIMYCYVCDDYGSAYYDSIKNLRECESIEYI